MANFYNMYDRPLVPDYLTKKDQLFTGILDFFPSEDEISFMNIRRITGDRVLEKLLLTGSIRELVKNKYHPEEGYRDFAFMADFEFKNIRILGCEKLEFLV